MCSTVLQNNNQKEPKTFLYNVEKQNCKDSSYYQSQWQPSSSVSSWAPPCQDPHMLSQVLLLFQPTQPQPARLTNIGPTAFSCLPPLLRTSLTAHPTLPLSPPLNPIWKPICAQSTAFNCYLLRWLWNNLTHIPFIIYFIIILVSLFSPPQLMHIVCAFYCICLFVYYLLMRVVR